MTEERLKEWEAEAKSSYGGFELSDYQEWSHVADQRILTLITEVEKLQGIVERPYNMILIGTDGCRTCDLGRINLFTDNMRCYACNQLPKKALTAEMENL